MKDLIIIGAGGFGREAAWLTERINAAAPQWNLLGYVDDNPALRGEILGGYPVLGGTGHIKQLPQAYVVCCIANTAVRKMLCEKAETFGNPFATLIDPAAILSDTVEIGEGSVICAGTAATIDIRLGRHCIIDVNSTVGHDAVLEDYVTLYPAANVSGCTCICEGVQLGTGSQVLQGLTVGANTFVGAGAVVVRDLPANCTAVGVPAKVVEKW